MIVTQLVMVAIMTMTPVHMLAHGHSVAAAGLVIAVHIGSMYLPSPVSGWLVDRFGTRVVAAIAGVTLLAAGILAAAAPVDSVPVLAAALALLGLGWSFGLVSGTAMLSNALPLATRAKTQGSVDLWNRRRRGQRRDGLRDCGCLDELRHPGPRRRPHRPGKRADGGHVLGSTSGNEPAVGMNAGQRLRPSGHRQHQIANALGDRWPGVRRG